MAYKIQTNIDITVMRTHSNRKLHSLLRLLRNGDQNGYGKRLEEEAEDQEGKSGEKKKAQGETLEEVASSHARANPIKNRKMRAKKGGYGGPRHGFKM